MKTNVIEVMNITPPPKDLKLSREVRIEFINDEGRWEALVECSAEYLHLHKERIMAGKSRAGSSTTFRAVAVDSGEVLEIWHSDGA